MVEHVIGQQNAEAASETVDLMAAVEQPFDEDAHIFRLGQGLGVDQQTLAVRQVMRPGIVLVLLRARLQQRAR